MRIEKLNPAIASRILALRTSCGVAAERVARRIVGAVRRGGDDALLAFCRKLDGGIATRAQELLVSQREIHQAMRRVDRRLLGALEHAAQNIRCVARQQLPCPWTLQVERGVRISQIVRPLESVACYVPGGRFSLVSTLLMTAIPAKVAGVKRVAVACPHPNDAVLAAAGMLGIGEVYRMGGAQAIAALAYGTRTIRPAVKICGPGNRYVTAAKRIVSSECATDMQAGPTELLVLATRGNPALIAADLLAQAEHDPEAIALCLTTSKNLATEIAGEVAAQSRRLPKGSLAVRALARHGTILVANSLSAMISFANRFAPEHLSVVGSERQVAARIESAGSVFLGAWSAQSFGDYVTGSNHVLPTGGWARARGGLGAADFVKCFTMQEVSAEGARRLAPAAMALARAEGLAAHRYAAAIRCAPGEARE